MGKELLYFLLYVVSKADIQCLVKAQAFQSTIFSRDKDGVCFG